MKMTIFIRFGGVFGEPVRDLENLLENISSELHLCNVTGAAISQTPSECDLDESSA